MGLGDAKLMAGGGFFLGWPGALWVLMLAFWWGAAFGIILMIGERRANLKREIPFGPFIALGVLSVFLFPEIFDNIFIFI